MGIFGSFTQELSDMERPFPEGKEIGFEILKFETNDFNAKLWCKVLNGDHLGKEYEVLVDISDKHAFKKQLKIKFFLLYFTIQQLQKDDYQPIDLVGKKFVAAPSYYEASNGNVYVTWQNFRLPKDSVQNQEQSAQSSLDAPANQSSDKLPTAVLGGDGL